MSAHFYDVNTPTMTNFKLSMWNHQMCQTERRAFDSQSVQSGSGIPSNKKFKKEKGLPHISVDIHTYSLKRQALPKAASSKVT